MYSKELKRKLKLKLSNTALRLTWVSSISHKQHSQCWKVHFLVILLSEKSPVHVTRLHHGHRRYMPTHKLPQSRLADTFWALYCIVAV